MAQITWCMEPSQNAGVLVHVGSLASPATRFSVNFPFYFGDVFDCGFEFPDFFLSTNKTVF